MKKLASLVLLAIAVTGCAKTGRAWVMDNSPYWDMLYEGARFHIGGLVAAGVVWWCMKDHWKFQYTKTPILAAAAVIVTLSGFGLYRGYDYIHTECTSSEVQTKNCPEYKMTAQWPTHYRLSD